MSDQYRSDIRNRFINVRGTRGEITDNMVYFLKEDNNVAASEKMDVYKDEETGEILAVSFREENCTFRLLVYMWTW